MFNAVTFFHRPFRPAVGATALLIAVAVNSVGCGTAPDLEVSRQFQQAEQQFAEAKSADDFVRVAAMYQEILDSGFRSGSVFYNQGNAWFQAGQKGRAIAAYRQAKQFLPRDPYLDANLATALEGRDHATGHSVLDYLFFWQKILSREEKCVLTTVLLALVLVLGWLPAAESKQVFRRRGRMVFGVLLLIAGLSVLRDWHEYDHLQHGVVIAETMARRGGSENYEPAFTQPLPDGTEFVVRDRVTDWLHVSLGGIGEGWIRERDAVIW